MISTRTRLGIEVLAAGLALGLVGDTLLRAMPWGLNVTLCAAALVGAGLVLVRRHHLTAGPDTPWLAITVLLLGAAFMRRDSEALAQFDVIGLLIALSLGAASLHGERIAALRPLAYLQTGVLTAANTIAGGFLLVGQDVRWEELPREGRLRHVRAVGLGVLLAAPLLAVFGSLFASADSVFGTVLTNLFAFDAGAVASHTFFIGFWAALTAGYLRWCLVARPPSTTQPTAETARGLGIVPVGTALGLINLLFLLFVVVQVRYFFGGAALVQQTTGLTYAEYARHGFFELVTASGLVLPVLLGADHLVRGETAAHLATFRRLAGLLLVLLAVIMASALERMRLYVAAFGLSEDRLYATAFMIYLLGVFAWLGWTVLRGRRQRFAFGALVQGFAVLTGLHVLNPDAFIVRTNLTRPAAERPFDAKYAISLGADAVLPLLDALPTLGTQEGCAVARGLLNRWDVDAADWRTWNWSRSRARRLVRERATDLRALPCPPSKEPS
ncbi:MAG TPA: DUF4173 domain-containing protein [Gemmatimonadales bacterium]|nr:DUF4173 domain-containing protein [Gemmatimonadales bacterium]